MDIRDSFVDAFLVEVRQIHRHFEPLYEQQGELACHQARADDPDLGDLACERLVWCAVWTFRPFLDQVERIDRGTELLAHDQVSEGLILRRERLVPAVRAGCLDQIEREVGRGSRTVDLHVGDRTAPCDGGPPRLFGTVDRLPLDNHVTAHNPGRPEQRLLQEVGRIEESVEDPELVRLLGLELAALAERVLNDHRDSAVCADAVRQEVDPAPTGQQAQEALRQRKGRSTRGNGPVCAVERGLEATAHGGTVHERERWNPQLAQPAEHGMTQLCECSSIVARPDKRNSGQVGADQEHERLAGYADRDNV